MRTRLRRLLALALLLAPGALHAQTDCTADRFDGFAYTACEIPAGSNLRLYWKDAGGAILGTFSRLDGYLRERGEAIVFAMNGAMYHPDRRPVGLYIEDGQEISGLVPGPGPGNFGMVPNGVLCIAPGRIAVIETGAFRQAAPDCTYAAQSGPMLVIDGALHPRFLVDATSRNIRNGIGVRPDGSAVAAISDQPVTFHEFARLFRDRFGTPNALYIDGSVSRLYAPQAGRADLGLPLGPMLALVKPAD